MKLLTPFAIDTPEETLQRKRLFAELLLKNPSNPFEVALKVLSDTGEALRAANEWPADLFVIDYQKQLIKKHGDMAFLPNEVESARLADDMARGKVRATTEQIAALKLYTELRGWTGKAATINNNNVVQVNRVMVVKDHGTDDEWEAKAIRQQARLRSEVVEHASD